MTVLKERGGGEWVPNRSPHNSLLSASVPLRAGVVARPSPSDRATHPLVPSRAGGDCSLGYCPEPDSGSRPCQYAGLGCSGECPARGVADARLGSTMSPLGEGVAEGGPWSPSPALPTALASWGEGDRVGTQGSRCWWRSSCRRMSG